MRKENEYKIIRNLVMMLGKQWLMAQMQTELVITPTVRQHIFSERYCKISHLFLQHIFFTINNIISLLKLFNFRNA